MKAKLIAGLLLGVAVAVLAGRAAAQAPTPSDDDVNAIAKQLYCPVCENVPLDVCPTQACAQWRQVIRDKLAQGWGEAQIKQHFVDQYGVRVLAAPPASGFSWLAYLLPPLAMAAGAVLLWRALRSWRAAAPPAGVEDPLTADDPYLARVEEEVRRRS
jgi:cytochrome c-type biogenesis protein CcmH